MAIKSVKVWRDPTKKECRIYVTASDGRQGCKYMTETHWHKRGEIDGRLTEAEWAEAKSIAVVDGKWTTVYEAPAARYTGTDEDARTDLEALNSYRQPNVLLSSDLG